jgi:hypothetical protein
VSPFFMKACSMDPPDLRPLSVKLERQQKKDE